MSTTVTYKGNTLTTAENQTRTLKTAGKYMEADVVITDVTSGGGGGWTDITSSCYLDGYTMKITTDIEGYLVVASLRMANLDLSEDYYTVACFYCDPNEPNIIIGEMYDAPSGSLLSIGALSAYAPSDSMIAVYEWINGYEVGIRTINWVKMIPMPT